MCNHDCTVTFDKHQATVQHQGKTILTAPLNNTTGLYQLTTTHVTTNKPTKTCAYMIPFYHKATANDLINFYHASLFAPTKSTWLQAIKAGHFIGWPGLTEDRVKKYLTIPPATHKGHLHQTRSNIHSTYAPPTTRSATPNASFSSIFSMDNHTFSYLTGQFPVTSSKNNKHIFILYHQPTNAILAEPLQDKSHPVILQEFTNIHTMLTRQGHTISHHTLNNDISPTITEYLQLHNITYQIVPPNNHRCNKAERGIQTFKAHFIAGLSLLPSQFPLHLWCRLLPQAQLTLNLLRSSNFNPNISEHASIWGNYDLLKHPIAPPGSQVMAHIPTNQRTSWAPRATPEFYLGPAMDHYCCYRIYVNTTSRERVTDSLEFITTPPNAPTLHKRNMLEDAANIIIDATSSPTQDHFNLDTIHALQNLADVFSKESSQFQTNPEPSTPEPATQPSHPQQHISTPVQRVQPPRKVRYTEKYTAALTQMITAKPMTYRKLIQYPSADTWKHSFANELGRLAQGLPSQIIKGTNTITFIHHTTIPVNKTVTYGRIVTAIRHNKKETHRTCLTVGGYRLPYNDNTYTETADLTTIKMLLNSVISTPHARFATCDIEKII